MIKSDIVAQAKTTLPCMVASTVRPAPVQRATGWRHRTQPDSTRLLRPVEIIWGLARPGRVVGGREAKYVYGLACQLLWLAPQRLVSETKKQKIFQMLETTDDGDTQSFANIIGSDTTLTPDKKKACRCTNL